MRRKKELDFYGVVPHKSQLAWSNFRSTVGVFVDLDILRQVQTVTSVYRSTSGTSRFPSSPRVLEAEQKTFDRFKSSEMEKFSRNPAMTFSNVEIKTRDNNMVNKAFERNSWLSSVWYSTVRLPKSYLSTT